MGFGQARACCAVLLAALLGCGDASDDGAAAQGGVQAEQDAGGAGAASGARDASSGPLASTDAAVGGAGGQPGADAGSVPTPTGMGDAAMAGGADGAAVEAPGACMRREISGEPVLHFHHVHFNTVDPEADLEFFQKFLDAPAVDFCRSADGAVTRATKTERGYFLYTRVAEPPDPTLNTYLEHVGWLHPDPSAELARLVALDVPLFPEGRYQCPEAAAGTSPCAPEALPTWPYWFYLLAPSGARIEVALGPGPATMGFGHVHMIMGVDLSFFATVSDGAFADGAIDLVNHTDVSLMESVLDGLDIVETRGKPIDHVAYSTTDLELARMRLQTLGITIEDDIAFRSEYGFDSFFVKSPKGIWVEIVADSPFVP